MDRMLVLKLASLFAFLMFSAAITLYEPLQNYDIVVRTTTNNEHFIAQVKNLSQAAFEDGVRWVVDLKPLHSANYHTFDFNDNETIRATLTQNLDCWGDFSIIYNECSYKNGYGLCPLDVDGRIDIPNSIFFSCG
jgi:hypothetical protein